MAHDRRRQRSDSEIEQNYRALIQNIKDYAIFMLDKKGKIVSWDQGGIKLFGYKRNEIIGKKFSILFTKENLKKGLPDKDMAIAVSEGRYLLERQYIRKNKTKFWANGLLTSTRDKNGTHQGFSKIMRDVTEQNNLHKTAVHNSTHDFLTVLPNRNFFEENLIESLPKIKKGTLLAVLYMDFNNFKRTNDQEGHAFGDLVLIEIAHRLTHSIRMTDVAARFGGDEFVILAKGLRSEADIGRFAQKVLNAFKPTINIRKKIIQTSVSIGISVYPSDGKKPNELLRFADMALYQAKKFGGNQYQFYTRSILDKKARRH
jgi:diguanylate cyclase (GGDEF)-like protein/PAS domain S-box-containing protein